MNLVKALAAPGSRRGYAAITAERKLPFMMIFNKNPTIHSFLTLTTNALSVITYN